MTSSTTEALTASLGSIEQAVLEAVAQDRQGFAGGWISSIALEDLLNELRASGKVPMNKRRDLLQSIGYDWHPGLTSGRVNVPSDIDRGHKTILFVKKNGPLCAIEGGAEIFRAYRDAQNRNPFATTPAVT